MNATCRDLFAVPKGIILRKPVWPRNAPLDYKKIQLFIEKMDQFQGSPYLLDKARHLAQEPNGAVRYALTTQVIINAGMEGQLEFEEQIVRAAGFKSLSEYWLGKLAGQMRVFSFAHTMAMHLLDPEEKPAGEFDNRTAAHRGIEHALMLLVRADRVKTFKDPSGYLCLRSPIKAAKLLAADPKVVLPASLRTAVKEWQAANEPAPPPADARPAEQAKPAPRQSKRATPETHEECIASYFKTTSKPAKHRAWAFVKHELKERAHRQRTRDAYDNQRPDLKKPGPRTDRS
jgi:hypothetical protein